MQRAEDSLGSVTKDLLMTIEIQAHKKDLSFAIMSNDELHDRLQSNASEERKLTHHILQLIAEVDSRQLYLPRAHSSLFDYLTKEIGYSAGSAQRRIDSARLLRQIPDLGNRIEEGSLNLSQISQLQRALRLTKKQDSTQLLPSEKKTLLVKLENKSGRETELILAQEFNFPVESQLKQKLQRDRSVRLELTLSEEQMEVLDQAKALLSHALSGGNLVDVIVHLAGRYIKSRTGSPAPSRPTAASNATVSAAGNSTVNATVAVKDNPLHREHKPLPASLKKIILRRDQGCQFKDLRTGRICGAKYFADVDHVQPRFAGGTHVETNLRQLCSAHKKFRYRHGC